MFPATTFDLSTARRRTNAYISGEGDKRRSQSIIAFLQNKRPNITPRSSAIFEGSLWRDLGTAHERLASGSDNTQSKLANRLSSCRTWTVGVCAPCAVRREMASGGWPKGFSAFTKRRARHANTKSATDTATQRLLDLRLLADFFAALPVVFARLAFVDSTDRSTEDGRPTIRPTSRSSRAR